MAAPGQMVVGLGLAESTPGPLIMVLEFVGFVGAYQNPGELDPLVGWHPRRVRRSLGDVRALLPVDLPRRAVRRELAWNRRLAAALQTVTAAVVGVIANLAVTFAIATRFDEVGTSRLLGRFDVPSPVWSSVDVFALVVATVAFVGLRRLRWKVLPVIGASALAGLVWYGLLGQ